MNRVHSSAEGGASIPTGADLNWRTVWPGQWSCDNAGYIWADSLKGGRTHMIDLRGWGYLTGRGMGALGLSAEAAERIQDELGALLCAAPVMLAALEKIAASAGVNGERGTTGDGHQQAIQTAREALKATTAPEAGAVGTTEGREPKNDTAREGADR